MTTASPTTPQPTPEPGTELVTATGTTSIADTVVRKIAGVAAREVAGVHDLGSGGSRAFGAIRERIPGLHGPTSPKGCQSRWQTSSS